MNPCRRQLGDERARTILLVSRHQAGVSVELERRRIGKGKTRGECRLFTARGLRYEGQACRDTSSTVAGWPR